MSATGALLLLAAAATFLAVNWDALGLTARVAAVGAATAGAILGGARLRRTLPAVGAVVFHLGALLLPVDALGLALQLEVGRAGTWLAVGATAVLTLPIAAHVGRSRVLAATALAGVPVLATGLGLAGVAPAPLVTAAAAVLALGVVRARGDEAGDPTLVLGLAAPILAITAVVGPLLVAAGSAVAVASGGSPVLADAAAGWVPSTWLQPAAAGVVAVTALVGTAALRRSARWAGAVPVLVALVAVTLLLPGDAPRLARLLPWPLLFLAIEATVVAARRDATLRGPVARIGAIAEAVAVLAVPSTLLVVATSLRSGAELAGFRPPVAAAADPVLAAVATVTALAWVIAAVRRGRLGAVGVAATAIAVTTVAAALTFLVPTSGSGLPLLLVAIAVGTGLRGGAERGASISAAVVTLAGVLLVGTWSAATVPGRLLPGVAEILLALLAAAIALLVAVRVVRHIEVGEGHGAAAILLPVSVGAILVAGGALDAGVGFAAWVLAVPALALACAVIVDRVPVGADAMRALAAATVLVAGPSAAVGLDAAVAAAPAATLVAVVLVVESVRCRRPWLLIAAGPIAVRAVAGAAYGLSGSRTTTGAVLLAVAVVAGLAAVVWPHVRRAGGVTAVVAAVPAIALLSLTPEAFAWGTVAVGVTVVAAGLLTRQIPVAHVGGVVTTLGVWQVLSLGDVTAVDVWMVPPALHLWLTGRSARRAGRVSSWVADVPPLALVVVPALLERLAGGSGWHAALAGILALTAVVGGGVGRHGGPLVVGVVAVVAVVLIETLAVVAAVPTWVWLTAGGVVLLGAGALIERTGGAPVATVRRMVDVVAERFD